MKEFVRLGKPVKDAERDALKHIPKDREPRGSNPKKQPILAIVQRHDVEGKKGSQFVMGFPIASEFCAALGVVRAHRKTCSSGANLVSSAAGL